MEVDEKELRKIFNPSWGEGYYTYIFRYIAYYFIKPVLKTNITPDQITYFYWAVHMVGVFLFAFGEYALSVIAILLIHFANFLDYFDGPIARYKKIGTLFGQWLDYMTHEYVNPVMFLALGIGIYINTNQVLFLFMSISMIISYYIYNAAILNVYKTKFRNSIVPKTSHPIEPKKNLIYLIKLLVKNTYSAPYSQVVLLIFVVANRIDLFLLFYGITYPFIAIINTIYEGKVGWSR